MRGNMRRVLVLLALALLGVGGYYAWRTYLAPGLPDGFASSNGRIELARFRSTIGTMA
jgi:predicted MFS family arabinose efflux permease